MLIIPTRRSLTEALLFVKNDRSYSVYDMVRATGILESRFRRWFAGAPLELPMEEVAQIVRLCEADGVEFTVDGFTYKNCSVRYEDHVAQNNNGTERNEANGPEVSNNKKV